MDTRTDWWYLQVRDGTKYECTGEQTAHVNNGGSGGQVGSTTDEFILQQYHWHIEYKLFTSQTWHIEWQALNRARRYTVKMLPTVNRKKYHSLLLSLLHRGNAIVTCPLVWSSEIGKFENISFNIPGFSTLPGISRTLQYFSSQHFYGQDATILITESSPDAHQLDLAELSSSMVQGSIGDNLSKIIETKSPVFSLSYVAK